MNAAVLQPAEQTVVQKIQVKKLNFFYGGFQALKDINLDIPERKVTAFIGPSGCGKSTLLRTFNRMYALYPKQEAKGEILLDGEDILSPRQDLNRLRAKVGMVFQKPTPFPMSIYHNIAFGVRLYESLSPREMDERVEWALRKEPLGRAAAAPVHRALHRGQARGAAPGRAGLGARSDLHRPHRGAGARA